MKTHRRQELKTNVLSLYIDRMATYCKENTNKIILFGVLIVVLICALVFSRYTRAESQKRGWEAYYAALSAGQRPDPNDPNWADQAIGQWKEVVATHQDPAVRSQAIWSLARLRLQSALSSDDPVKKKELLSEAEENAKTILAQFGSNVPLKAAALNALASIEQDRFLDDRLPSHKEQARDYLQQIRNGREFRGTPFQNDVLARINTFEEIWNPVILVDPPPKDPPDPLVSEAEQTSNLADEAPLSESASEDLPATEPGSEDPVEPAIDEPEPPDPGE